MTFAQKRVGPSQAVKRVVAIGNSTAVAYWGGTLEIVDSAGKTTHHNEFPQDITALATRGNELLVGTADGRIVAVEVK
jgi:hypothetical protein